MNAAKLCSFARQPASTDSGLKPPEKKAQLQEISLFLKTHGEVLSSETLADLVLLKERVLRLDASDSTLLRTIDTLISRISPKEDALALKMSRMVIPRDPQFDAFLKHLDENGIDTTRLLKEDPSLSLPQELLQIFFRGMNIDSERASTILRNKLLEELKSGIGSIELPSNTRFPLNITRLALVVSLGQEPLLKHFLENGLNARQADSQGYTPAHFAAIFPNLRMLFTLCSHGAKLDAKTVQGATVYDILRARGFARDKHIRTVELEGGSMTATCDSLFTTDALLSIWRNCQKPDDASMTHVEKKLRSDYQAMKEGKKLYESPISLRKCPKGHLLEGEWEAYASRTIEAGEVIDEYSGIVECLTSITDSTYVADLSDSVAVNAQKQGSFAKRINHGFPNCVAHTITYRGIPRKVVMALRKIEKGETLYFNYGPDYFKSTRKFVELSPDDLKKCVLESKQLTTFDYGLVQHQGRWVDCAAKIEKGTFSLTPQLIHSISDEAILQGAVRHLYANAKLKYLLLYPEHLIELIKQKVVSKENVLSFFQALSKMPHFAKAIEDDGKHHLSMLQLILSLN